MRAIHIPLLPVTALSVAALLAAAVAPAQAATAVFPDPVDTPDGVDVTSMKVKHENRAKIVHRHAGMDDDAAVQMTYWLDTKPRDAGPEYRIWFAANADGLQVRRVDSWRDDGEKVECDRYGALADVFDDDPIVMWVHRSCVGEPRKVRVGAKVREFEDGTATVDMVPAERRFSDWVRRG